MCWCWKKSWKKSRIPDSPKIVDGSRELESPKPSVWRVVSNKMSSWSLPKNSAKQEFETKFDEYLALEPSSDGDVSDTDSVSSSLSELLG